MVIPFLFTISLCAFSHAAKAQTIQLVDLIPTENRVQVERLSNGIRTYVQDNRSQKNHGSFRVVLKKPMSEEEIYRYDGSIDSLDCIEHFFNYCKEKASTDFSKKSIPLGDDHFSSSDLPTLGRFWPKDIAVVAVGDFPVREMQTLIQKHFDDLELDDESNVEEDPIKIGTDPNISKIAVSLSFPTPRKIIRTYNDLKEAWKMLLLQDLFQQRLERCSRGLDEIWVHPHPRFFCPVRGYSLVSHEGSENLLSFFLWQVESIRSEGFYEDEFYITKKKLLNQLHYLASIAVLPDDAFLASYFADQFLLGDCCLSYESFMNASSQLVEEIQPEELFPLIDSLLFEQNRSIQVTYPIPTRSEILTKGQIEEMIERVASLASFYRESQVPEEEIWISEAKDHQARPKFLKKSPDERLPFIKLANQNEPEGFKLAENIAIPVNNDGDPTAPFYQLPISEKEKRIIKYILTTMSEKNILQLAFVKRTMEKKGRRIEHIHPMRFIGYILSNSELRSCLRTIRKSSFKWDAFIDGFARRMREEYSNNNLYVHVPGFCQLIGANQEDVTQFIQRKDWEGLVKEYM